MAPANAKPPPISQTRSTDRASGTSCATRMGMKKIPPPMTFETTMAAASSGPRRRSSVAAGGSLTRRPASLREELTRDRELSDRRPLRVVVFREQLHAPVDEVAVLKHLLARLGARVAVLRAGGQR